jgi:hypothetical protein
MPKKKRIFTPWLKPGEQKQIKTKGFQSLKGLMLKPVFFHQNPRLKPGAIKIHIIQGLQPLIFYLSGHY